MTGGLLLGRSCCSAVAKTFVLFRRLSQLQLSKSTARLFSNRSACYVKLKKFDKVRAASPCTCAINGYLLLSL